MMPHLHVLYGVDGHTSHAHVTRYTRMIGIVASVRREIERDTQSLLPCEKTTE